MHLSVTDVNEVEKDSSALESNLPSRKVLGELFSPSQGQRRAGRIDRMKGPCQCLNGSATKVHCLLVRLHLERQTLLWVMKKNRLEAASVFITKLNNRGTAIYESSGVAG